MKGRKEKMNKEKFIDLDNTLIVTNPIYETSNHGNAMYIKEVIGLPHDIPSIRKQMDCIDEENIKEMGFAPERYIRSWVQTYEHYCNQYEKRIEGNHKDQIIKIANKVFETNIPVFPNTHETLDYLKNKGYKLHLLTLGDVDIQTKRIKDADLGKYFVDIHIVPRKSTEALTTLLQQNAKDPNELVMIGDSLKSDIKPALDNGMKAIHIKKENWVFDQCEIDLDNPNYMSIYHIEELRNIF